MKMIKIMMAALFAVGMTLGLAGMASAAAISCGNCHSNPPVNGDNCAGDARGLHGTHVNYSSTSYKDVDSKCDYCHTAVTGTAPTATHNNNYINVTSTAKAPSLDYTAASSTCTNACHKNDGATAPWGNYTAIVVGGIKLTCTSCHDDSAALSTNAHAAHLGTSVTVSGLGAGTNADCDACHPDNTADLWSGGIADDGTKKAYPHAADGTNVVSSNATLDGGVGFTGTNCTGACHDNQTADVWTDSSLTCTSCHSDDAGTGTALGGAHTAHFAASATCSDCHAVPSAGDTSHASALPAVSDNATLIAGVSFNDGANTCAAACHTNKTNDVWTSGTLQCDSCHYWEATPGSTNNTAATVTLGGSHNAHFDAAVDCENCHSEPGSIALHAAYTLPVTDDNATVSLSGGGTFNDGPNTCSNTGAGCHLSGTPTWGGSLTCVSCHNYPAGGSNWSANNGHAVQYDSPVVNTHLTASGYNASSDDYATVIADTSKCGKCHAGGTHQNSTVDHGASGNNYCGSGEFTFNGSGNSTTCLSVSCHSGRTTPQWN